MDMTGMTIGALAKAAGVHVETVRYYQRIGLLTPPLRAHGTIRRYPQQSLQRLRFIRRAQQLGFSLEEVAHLLELGDSRYCAETRDMAAEKLAAINAKIADLAAMKQVLAELVTACGKRSGARGCPIIDSLTRQEE